MKSSENSFPVAGETQGKREETIENLVFGEIALKTCFRLLLSPVLIRVNTHPAERRGGRLLRK
jgi:hypothetical protein